MMAREYNETTNKLTNKDLKKLGLRSMFYQTGFTFEKMQGNSFGWSILPGLEKIHGKDSEEVSKALDEYGVDFINTEQHADRKSTRLNSSHKTESRMPSSA